MAELLLEQIATAISEWKPMMRISDWQIDFSFATRLEIKERTERDDCVAHCTRNRLIKQALIEIDPDHRDTTDDWRLVLAHEMFHIVTDDFHYHASCLLDFVSEEAYETFENQLDTYYERLVEDLAKGFIATVRQAR